LDLKTSKASEALNLIERIRLQIEEKIFSHDSSKSFSITATFGVAVMSVQSSDQNSFLEQAVNVLYRAKGNGSNQIAVYDI
jgi:diguanylate cyclase (GGDEF)-like protein